jgi:hypothetical protein
MQKSEAEKRIKNSPISDEKVIFIGGLLFFLSILNKWYESSSLMLFNAI